MIKKKKIANDFERSTQTYFSEISNFSPLSRDEEFSLWKKYKENNDLSARDKIIKSNLKFVASEAKNFQGLGLSYSDLIAEGNAGLMKAMDKFDYEKGFKTISYSVHWIRQTILEALEKRNLIDGDDLPEDFEKPLESDDENVYINNDNATNEEYIDNGLVSEFKLKEEKKAINLLFACLTEREKSIMTKYFGLGGAKEMTLEDIGKQYGLTKERVRQIKEKCLKKLRSEALINLITSDIYN